MTKFDRLEDITPGWRTYFSDKLAGAEAEQVRRGVEAVLPERVDVGDPGQLEQDHRGGLRDASPPRPGIRHAGVSRVAPRERLLGRGRVAREPGDQRDRRVTGWTDAVYSEAPGPGRHGEELLLGHPVGRWRGHRGGRAGPLTLLLFNSREVGLFVGGMLGAAGLVALVGVLASRPEIAGGLETGLKWFGFIAVPIGLWRGMRGRPLGWLLRRRVHAGILVAVGDRAAPDGAADAGRGARRPG